MATHGLVALLVSLLARPSVGAPGFALTSTTLGATGPKVTVLVVPMDLRSAQEQGAIEAAAEAALTKAGRFTVVPVQDAFNPTNAVKRAELMATAREKLSSGKKAIDDLDNVKATADFRDALDFLQQADLSREFPAMVDAWVMKAAGHATGGETAPAKKDIEAVVALDPRAEFSPTYFSPDYLKFADTQKKQAANAKGQLLVKTEPAGARVWVDGQLRGVSPITVDGLSAGKHFVTAVAGGYALLQSQAAPGETSLELTPSELAADWKKAMLDIKRDPDGSTRDAAAQALAQKAGVDQVLLVIAKKSTVGEQLEFTAARLEARDGHNDAYATATLGTGDPEALAAFFDPLAATDAKRDGKSAVHHFAGAGATDAKKIATYSLLGGGALVLITAITLGTVALVFHDNFLKVPQPQSYRSNQLRTQGRSLALVSDILYGVGGAAVIGGGVLFALDFFGSKSPAKPISPRSDAEPQKAVAPAREEEKPVEEKPAPATESKAEPEPKKEEPAPAAEEKPKEEVKEEKPAEEPPPKKLSKKEQAALERKEREEAARQKREEEKRRKEEEREAAKKKKEEEKEAAKRAKQEAAAKKAEEEAAAKKKAEDDARAAEEAERKKKEEEDRKRREKKKKEEDHDDLRYY